MSEENLEARWRDTARMMAQLKSATGRQAIAALSKLVGSCAVMLLIASPAQSAVQVGQVDPNPGGFCQATIAAMQDVSAPGTPGYALPSSGILTSWSTSNDTTAGTAKLKVFRRTTNPNNFTVVAEDGPRPAAASTINTFPLRVELEAGDVLGLVKGNSCLYSQAPNKIKCFTPDPAVPSLVSPSACQDDYRVNVAATLEPDADHDGFGDETQDKCPTDKSTQGVCQASPDNRAPNADVGGSSTQNIVKQRAVIVTVQPNEASTLNGTGTLAVGNTSKVFTLKPAGASAGANAKVKLRLLLTKKALKAAKRALRKRRKVKASVSVAIKDAAGNTTVLKKTISAKRGKKRKRA